MKKVLVSLAVVIITISIPVCAQDKSGDAEQQITAMERKWAGAVKAGDADTVAPMVADRYINMSTSGALSDKVRTLENIRKSKWQETELSDIKVTSFGSTAIATGGWHGKGTGADGKPVEVRERWMDTWIKTPDGKWQCVATASAPAK